MAPFAYLKVAASAMALCIGASAVIASPITRMDIFDRADNQLLFVTFDYNASGDCIGRSVFTGDSTFLRSTTFQPGSATTATKENSLDYNGNPLFTTTVNPPSSGKTSFSTVDQFGLSQFGSPLSYSETATNTFDISQAGNTLCKEQYEYDGNGDLTRITILDKNSTLAMYALVSHQTAAVRPVDPLPAFRNVRLSANRGKIRLQLDLAENSLVNAEIFTPAGRKALSIINQRVAAGSHLLFSDCTTLGNGSYAVKITVNGTVSATRMIAIQK